MSSIAEPAGNVRRCHPHGDHEDIAVNLLTFALQVPRATLAQLEGDRLVAKDLTAFRTEHLDQSLYQP